MSDDRKADAPPFDADDYVRTALPFALGQLLGLLDRGDYVEARAFVLAMANDLFPKIGGTPYQ